MSTFKSNLLPDSFRRCMAKEERKELHISTSDESIAKAERGDELKMHQAFLNECRRLGIITIHSRTDRKPTIEEGHPDFTLLHAGKGCCIEFKAGSGKLTEQQVERLLALTESKVPTRVCYNLDEAIAFTREFFGLVEG